MKSFRHLIPSLNALLDFESVARLESFTRAADELGVTQAAVSRQIRHLEELLGFPLFRRLHRSIQLTPKGQVLYETMSGTLQNIAATLERLGAADETDEVSILSTVSFSHFRLLPRLPALKRAHPSLNLCITAAMADTSLLGSSVDIAVRYGSGRWHDGRPIKLFDEQVMAVCSPAWLASHRPPETVEDIAGAPLIAYDDTPNGWMGWQEWFREFGIERKRTAYALKCTLYTDAIQAALQGHGIVLAWTRLLEDLLAEGRLVPVANASVVPRDAYYAVLAPGRALTQDISAVLDWLKERGPGSVVNSG